MVVFPEHYVPYNHILNDFQDKFIDIARLYYKIMELKEKKNEQENELVIIDPSQGVQISITVASEQITDELSEPSADENIENDY